MVENKTPPKFLSGGGEMGERIRTFDWSASQLGPPENWEQSLKTCVQIMLASSQPIWIGWVPQLITLYNDPHKAIVGGKHPNSLGKPASEVWAETWSYISPKLKTVLETEQGTSVDSELLIMDRNNYPQETYCTFSYSPIAGENGATAGIICFTNDDTARVQNEQSLEVLRDYLEAGDIGTFDYYPLLNQLVWSDKIYQFLGINPSKKPSLDKFFEHLHPEDVAAERNKTADAMNPASGGHYENEYRVVKPNGNIGWVRSKGRVTFDQDLRPVRFTGVIQEITKYRQIEQDYQENDLRFKTMADQSPIIVFEVDNGDDFQVSYFNKVWYEFTGCDAAEPLGNGWAKFVHPGDLKTTTEILESAYKTKSAYIIDSIRIRRYDGEYRYHFVRANSLFNEKGEFQGYIGVSFEIHDRLMADRALKQSEERFRLLAEKLPQLVWVTDSEGNPEYVSKRWKKYTGRDCTTKQSWYDIVFLRDQKFMQHIWDKSLQTGIPIRGDVRLRDVSGNFRWHTLNGEPIYAEGKIVKWVGSFTDIHHERTFSEELEALVELRTNELVSKNDKLEKMNKELEAFAYISSHDLQEPLRKIQTFASRIMDREYDALSEAARGYFQRMQDSANRMQILIEDLLTYSRTNTEERNFEWVNLEELVDEVREDLAEAMHLKGAEIQTGKSCRLEIIPFQFRQLLHNLIGNSLKFARPDTPAVIKVNSEIKLGKEISWDKAKPSRNYCHITVSDNGIGFEPEYGEKIFEVFQRLHGRDKFSGTGIGLAIVKKIVDNHNGMVTACSAPGKGATFELYIPEKA
jgi:PAS domain S-box-containing protein